MEIFIFFLYVLCISLPIRRTHQRMGNLGSSPWTKNKKRSNLLHDVVASIHFNQCNKKIQWSTNSRITTISIHLSLHGKLRASKSLSPVKYQDEALSRYRDFDYRDFCYQSPPTTLLTPHTHFTQFLHNSHSHFLHFLHDLLFLLFLSRPLRSANNTPSSAGRSCPASMPVARADGGPKTTFVPPLVGGP